MMNQVLMQIQGEPEARSWAAFDSRTCDLVLAEDGWRMRDMVSIPVGDSQLIMHYWTKRAKQGYTLEAWYTTQHPNY
jgi:hypothetical protein